MTGTNQQSIPVAERLIAWVDDVQLSARVGFPHYANPGELKADIRSLVEQLRTVELDAEKWRGAAERMEAAYTDSVEQYEGERTKNEKLSALIIEQEGQYRDEKRGLLEQLETALRDRDQECVWRTDSESREHDLREQLEATRMALARLADLHHRVLTNSKLHDPERIDSFRDCPCKTCRDASVALTASNPKEE